METAREILQFLHYHPLSSREEIRVGIDFQESDVNLLRAKQLARFQANIHQSV
jgi:hypothetical protein